MPDQATSHITLSQLAASIGAAITGALPAERWVVAEVSECKVAAAGHCYLSLVEREAGSASPKAEIRAAIWAQRYRMIASYFRQQTGGELTAGIKVLVKCGVSYHPVYGLSLVISDIDPTYTVGQSERERQLAIAQLKTDGVFDMQQHHTLPLVIQRLAVISSATAAGYEDFCQQIAASPYRFEIELFTSAMQGVDTERGVIAALEKIAGRADQFDVVVIIRGGGSASDLRWFDSYDVAANVAQFPLPVLTGIGHEKDTSVTDMVAHRMFKTPTAVAAGLIDRISVVDNRLTAMSEQLFTLAEQRIIGEQQRVSRIAQSLQSQTLRSLSEASTKLERLRSTVPSTAMSIIERNRSQIEMVKNALPSAAMSIIERNVSRLEMVKNAMPSAALSIIERNVSRLEMVKNKLPSAAMSIIERNRSQIEKVKNAMPSAAMSIIERNVSRLEMVKNKLPPAAMSIIERNRSQIEMVKNALPSAVKNIFDRQHSALALLLEKVAANNPRRILSLGYSIAVNAEGRAIKSLKDTKIGASIRLEFSDGVAEAQVTNRIENPKL